ncbi:MAG: hydA [Clostridiales bacterium]|nr:hydA [Clostridiales bacterium]
MALIIKNGFIITEEGIIKSDILIENEKITTIASNIIAEPIDEIIDANGKFIMPGIIDAHVHYYMKTAEGRTIDNYESGTTSAAFGGVTTFIDYASPIEGKGLLEALKARENEAQGHSFIDYNFHMEITGEFEQDFNQLQDLKKYGITSLKIYTTYGSSQLSEDRIPSLLKKAKENNMLVTVHAEDNDIVTNLKKKFIHEEKSSPKYHAESRPNEAETTAIKKILKMAKEVDAPVYFVHVSTGEGAEIIKNARISGQKVYGETCPHYLLLTDDCYKGEEPQKYIMTPPLRKGGDQNILWKSIVDGTLQCITTDHCSFHIKDKLKSKSCFDTIPGIGGSETLLSLLFSQGVNKEFFSIEHMVSLLSTNPAKMFGLYPQKGTIKVGSDGDLVIFDPKKEVTLKGSELHSAAEYTVFEGYKLKGYPVMTIIRGSIICKNNKLMATKPTGKFIRARNINT